MSSEKPKILIVGASPDGLNLNAQIRSYLARGIEDLLSPEQVRSVPYEYGAEAVETYAPDLIIVFGSCMPDICDYNDLKRAAVSAKAHLAFWLHDDPYEIDYNFRAIETADTIFTNDKWALEFYRFDRVYHLPLAACRHAHYREPAEHAQKKFDLFFAGAGFENRVRLIRDIAGSLAGYRFCVRGSGWPEGLAVCRNELVSNELIADHYARSWMVLNVGRDLDLANERFRLPASTPGPRTFEAAMAGCVQLYFVTGLEIEDYFKSDEEILLFDHADEVPDLVETIACDPERAQSIALAAQKRALRDHTYSARARRILDICIPNWCAEENQRMVHYTSAAQ